jgi:hypothetical protein
MLFSMVGNSFALSVCFWHLFFFKLMFFFAPWFFPQCCSSSSNMPLGWWCSFPLCGLPIMFLICCPSCSQLCSLCVPNMFPTCFLFPHTYQWFFFKSLYPPFVWPQKFLLFSTHIRSIGQMKMFSTQCFFRSLLFCIFWNENILSTHTKWIWKKKMTLICQISYI